MKFYGKFPNGSKIFPSVCHAQFATNQALAEAYEVLSDEEKRGNYDAFGMDGLGTFGEKRPKKEKKKNHEDDVFGNFVDEEEFQVRF